MIENTRPIVHLGFICPSIYFALIDNSESPHKTFMNPTETAHQNLLFDIQYALNNSLYIVKLVDWSAERRLPRNSETYRERSSFLLCRDPAGAKRRGGGKD